MGVILDNGKVEVLLNGNAYTYRLDMGALLVFEQFSSKLPEEMKTPQRITTVMHYACLYNGEGFDMSYDEFVDAIDTLEVFDALREAATIEEKRWGARNLAGADAGKTEEDGEESKKK
jgi:hypothetical protein